MRDVTVSNVHTHVFSDLIKYTVGESDGVQSAILSLCLEAADTKQAHFINCDGDSPLSTQTLNGITFFYFYEINL